MNIEDTHTIYSLLLDKYPSSKISVGYFICNNPAPNKIYLSCRVDDAHACSDEANNTILGTIAKIDEMVLFYKNRENTKVVENKIPTIQEQIAIITSNKTLTAQEKAINIQKLFVPKT